MILLIRALQSQQLQLRCWLYGSFLEETGELHLRSNDSDAAFVSITLALAGTPESLEPGFSEVPVIIHCVSHSSRLLQTTASPGHAQKTACAFQDAQASAAGFVISSKATFW